MIMEIETERTEARVVIRDDELKTKHLRNFYLYKDSMSVSDLISWAFERAVKFQVSEILVVTNYGYGQSVADTLRDYIRHSNLNIRVLDYRELKLN
jgi:hypothetical protein